MPVNSHDFPDVYRHLGVELGGLGCVMLDVEPLPVREALSGLSVSPDEALYTSPDPKKFWIKGPVGQEGGHVTLLYGILKHLWRATGHQDDYFPDIDALLADWQAPDELELGPILQWPDPAGGPSTTLVAEVRVTPQLLEAHQRLSLLPHIDTFLGYHPHVTLAYVRSEFAEESAELLDYAIGGLVQTVGLSYGHPA